MREIRLVIPTYNGVLHADLIDQGKSVEFGVPYARVLVYREDGVRIVLGTHDHGNMGKPDIKIERRPNGWAIFLHPVGGGDPSGYVYFLDDGRSFLLKESALGPTPEIEVRETDEAMPEVDQATPRRKTRTSK